MEGPPLLELLGAIRPTAKLLGYAVAVHGSLARDVDLVAIPWVPITASAEELVEAIRRAVGGVIMIPPDDERRFLKGYMVHSRGQNPEPKPHGRLAWSIHLLEYGTYLDVSVVPTTMTYEQATAEHEARRAAETTG